MGYPQNFVLEILLCAPLFALLEYAFAAPGGAPRARADWGVDGFYYALNSTLLRPVKQGLSLALIAGWLALAGRAWPAGEGIETVGPLAALPLWAQFAAALAIYDLAAYWTHRLLHAGWPWRVHATHHSATTLRWLSAERTHPLEVALYAVLPLAPVLVVGLTPALILAAYPLVRAQVFLTHANLDWDYGPLRAVWVSPRFHRWHHTFAREGGNKNFSFLLPLWDILFGTYYMPPGLRPRAFGADDGPAPRSIPGQLLHPFRRRGG